MNEHFIQPGGDVGVFYLFSLRILASLTNNPNFLSKAVAVCSGDCFSSILKDGIFGHRFRNRGHTLSFGG